MSDNRRQDVEEAWEKANRSPGSPLQKAAKRVKTAKRAVRRAADLNDRHTYEYSVKAADWANEELKKENKKEAKRRSTSKRYENQK
jgi:hypothetical protein